MALNREEIENLMKNLMKEQEERIFKRISKKIETNTNEILEKINKFEERIERIEDQMSETNNELEGLKDSVTFTQNLIDDKMKEVDKLIEKKTQVIREHQSALGKTTELKIKELKEKNRALEDRSRRNNLRVDGLEERENETWKDCEKKIKMLMVKKLKMEKDYAEGIVIERAHRVGQKKKDKPRTVIFKLLNYKDKEEIIGKRKMLKNSGIYIDEDFSFETIQIRKKLRKDMYAEREKGRFSYISYDKLVSVPFKATGK